MNTSGDFPSTLGNITGENGVPNGTIFGPFNITFLSGWNSSKQDYVDHLFNFTYVNATFLMPCYLRLENSTCMETAWVGSGFNVTWNTSIYTNWSRIG